MALPGGGWDRAEPLVGFATGAADDDQIIPAVVPEHESAIALSRFLLDYRDEKATVTDAKYRTALINAVSTESYYVEVSIEDLMGYDAELAMDVRSNPRQMLVHFERGALLALMELRQWRDSPPFINIGLIQERGDTSTLRELEPRFLNQLVQVSGICTAASRVKPKATTVVVRCRQCGDVRRLEMATGFTSVSIPARCMGQQPNLDVVQGERCPYNPYVIDARQTVTVNQQTLKLQEAPETVATGEIPRHLLITLDRSLCGIVHPGERVSICGVYSVFGSSEEARVAYLHGLGLRRRDATLAGALSREEVDRFRELAKDPDIQERIAESIAPALVGRTMIKKAIAAMFFSGTAKTLPDGHRIRGDINVLLLGDPSTGKSQFLKFADQTAPICVYTSGKGSSAAGLTATIVRDAASGEFLLEGGAMVLADGGIVCIDELDKADSKDIVAIHEAMEQQTISIAKAGITTVLNSRCAVLAAANPRFGSFDSSASVDDNIEFQSTILSRFDLIFFVRDNQDRQTDEDLAMKLITFHQQHRVHHEQAAPIPPEILRQYVRYARQTVEPRLDPEAAEYLTQYYTHIRSSTMDGGDATSSSVPITIRQLEAVVRLAEAFARMELREKARKKHAIMAKELFEASTMAAVSQGLQVEGLESHEHQQALRDCMERVKEQIAKGSTVRYRTLRSTLLNLGFAPDIFALAVSRLSSQEILSLSNNNTKVTRAR